VKVLDHDEDADSSMVYTDPDVGDYHRMLLAGTYDLQYIAEGYFSQTVTSITLAEDTSMVTVNIQLIPESADTDSDGIIDSLDNCPEVYNPGQQDSDGDDEGDACECCQGMVGNANCDELDGVDISDITRLIDYLYLTHEELCCLEEANASGDSELVVDISDITALIDYLYLSQTPLSDCF